MSVDNTKIIDRLSAGDREQIVDVLAAAFINYPAMKFMLGRECPEGDDQLRALVGFYTDSRLINEAPVLGIRIDDTIRAVCLVSEPTSPSSDAVDVLHTEIRATLGEAAYARMERFEDTSDAMEPEEDYHFIGMLAVHPDFQGRGLGPLLVKRVKEISRSAGSDGVCLTTEDARNLPIYERLGFSIRTEADVDELHTWCLTWNRVTDPLAAPPEVLPSA
jgi:GNAT superfamily N-acetyltransferase